MPRKPGGFGDATNDWLAAPFERDVPAVLVSVARLDGSGPREAGAKMLLTHDAQFGSIGGGHLELRAGAIARDMLGRSATGDATAAPRRLQRFALAAGLGQCCGGVVHILFEVLDQDYRELLLCLRQRASDRQDSWRMIPLDRAGAALLRDAQGEILCGNLFGGAGATPCPGDLSSQTSCAVIRDAAGQDWLIDPCLAYRQHLVLFGAGHVGAALVRALADLPCYITWVDERENVFPARIPANVGTDGGDGALAMAQNAAAGTSFLVMTHSHALDLQLAEAILRRECSGWFGMIGSLSKRMQFEHRLRARGIADARLRDMVCPIGLPGIAGKTPAVIAASVCAQLLQWWSAALAAPPAENARAE